MPKNKGKGGKGFRSGKKTTADTGSSRKLEYKTENQEYGRIIKALGSRNFMVLTNEGKEIVSHVPKKFKHKSSRVWFNVDDIVLITVRSSYGLSDNMADIIYKYLPNEAKKLGKLGELSDQVSENLQNLPQEEAIIFEEEENNEVDISKVGEQDFEIDLDDL